MEVVDRHNSDQFNSINVRIHDVIFSLKTELMVKKAADARTTIFPDERHLIFTIQDLILNIVKAISEDKRPTFAIRNQRLWHNCCINSERLELKNNDAVMFEVQYSPKPSKDFVHIVYLLGRIYKLLLTQSTCTKRELFYENINLFEDQSQLDSVADKVCCLLGVAQWDLGLSATSKGLVAGPLYIATASGDILDCSPFGGVSVPQDLSTGIHLHSKAQFVLLIEKDSTFQKLLDEGFLEHNGSCIMVTGKGYPDLNTRLLIKFIWEQLEIPILAIVDADPYGIEIMCVYRFGSLKQSHIGDRLAIPSLKWLGVHPSDILELNINSSPLSDFDYRRIHNLMTRPYITADSCLN